MGCQHCLHPWGLLHQVHSESSRGAQTSPGHQAIAFRRTRIALNLRAYVGVAKSTGLWDAGKPWCIILVKE